MLEQLGAPLGVVMHLKSIMSATAQLGPGSLVFARAVVNVNASLHQEVMVSSVAVVHQNAICGAYSQLGVNVAMAGGSRLGPLVCLAPVKCSTAARAVPLLWHCELARLIQERA